MDSTKFVFLVVVVVVIVTTFSFYSISPSNIGRPVPVLSNPYLVALQYEEQLASATRNFFQLVNLTVHWNRRAVEPFVRGSTYAGIPARPELKGLLRFSAIYNLSSATVEMDKCFSRSISLYSFEDFLVNATRKFILLVLRVSSDQSGRVTDCTNNQSEGLRKAEDRLNAHLKRVKGAAIAEHGQYYEFKGIRAVCAEASKLSVQDVANELLSGSNKHLSVVVAQWRCIWNIGGPGGFFYYHPDYSWEFIDRCHVFSLARTQWITDAANEYRDSLNLSGSVIGVHLRIEKLADDEVKQHGHIDSCLEKTRAVAQALLKKYNLTSGNIVVVHDGGKYGSEACGIGPRSKCDKVRDLVLKKLDSWGLRVVSYDPASFQKPHHSGFVSVVEKEFITGTEHLIVAGGGGYQSSIKTLYSVKHGSSEQIYSVCQHFNRDHIHDLQIE